MAKKPADSSTFTGNYSFVNDLAASVPEINALMQEAAGARWDPQRFAQALQATQWWKRHSDTARQQIALSKSDPATYEQNVNNARAHVQALARQMGVKLTGDQVRAMATADLYQGLDDEALTYNISKSYSPGTNAQKTGGGTAAEYANQIKAMASDYGIPMSDKSLNNWVQNALSTGSLGGVQTYIVNAAKQTYSGIAHQIDASTNVRQLAGTYIDSMAQVLEIDPDAIKLTDPTIQRALQSKAAVASDTKTSNAATSAAGQTGTGAQPLWQFQEQLKNDPRWQKTQNARDTAYGLLHDLGKSFGFAS